MTTKNPFRYSWFWAVLAVALAASAAYATEVTNVTLGRFEDFAVVTLYGDGPLTVTHQLVEAKDGKPNRIVVDVAGARHALPDHNFHNLPKSSITAIRTSQFAVSPEPVVRIVLDLATPAAYQLKNAGRRVRVMISLPQDPPIPFEWSACDLSTGNTYADIESDLTQRPDVPAVKGTPAAEPVTIATAPNSETAPATKAKPDATPDQTTAAKPAAKSTEKPAAKSAPIPQPAADARPAYAQDNVNMEQPRYDQIVPMPQPKTKADQEIHYDIPAPAPVKLTQTPAPARTEPKSAAKAKPEQPVKAESNETPIENEATQVGEINDPATNPDAPATSLPDEGSKPVASLTTLPPMVTPTEIVPDREKVVYRTMGRRDPFAPLIKIGAAYNAAALPDVNTLRMVGVLHDVNSSWGLFEDANGYGYILKQGDRVRNGRLAKLTQNKAFFQLTEFGWSRSVQLDLEREG